MRQVNMTSLGETDDCWFGEAKERSLEQQLRVRAPQTWTVLCASVDQYLRTTVDSGSQPTPMENGAVMSTCACCGKAGHQKAKCRFRNAKCSNCGKTGHLRAMCADNVRNLLASQVPRAAVARVLAKAARAAETQTSAIVVDRSVIDDLIALVETRVAACVASVVI